MAVVNPSIVSANNNLVLAWLDGIDGEDAPVIPGIQGAQGAQGIQGLAGQQGLLIYEPEEPEFPLIIPGPKGDTGAQGPAGSGGSGGLAVLILDAEQPEDPLVIPGPAGATGPAGSGFNLLRTTGNQTINAGAGVFTDITGLTFPVVNGTRYAFKFYIVFQSAATATGWKASVNCPAGTLDFFMTYQTVANSATAGVATWLQKHSFTRDDMTLLTTTVTQNEDLVVIIEGRYLCTADGTFAARFANELAANTNITVREGSWGFWF